MMKGLGPLIRAMEHAGGDARQSVRGLWQAKGFAPAAVLTLALGIGAATAIASVVNTVLLEPLPFAGSDRLVRIIEYAPHPIAGRPPLQRGFTYPEWLDWRTRGKSFETSAAVVPMSQRMVRT